MLQFLTMLAIIITAIWAPHIIETGLQRARYYCRSHGITNPQPSQRGYIKRDGFNL